MATDDDTRAQLKEVTDGLFELKRGRPIDEARRAMLKEQQGELLEKSNAERQRGRVDHGSSKVRKKPDRDSKCALRNGVKNPNGKSMICPF